MEKRSLCLSTFKQIKIRQIKVFFFLFKFIQTHYCPDKKPDMQVCKSGTRRPGQDPFAHNTYQVHSGEEAHKQDPEPVPPRGTKNEEQKGRQRSNT